MPHTPIYYGLLALLAIALLFAMGTDLRHRRIDNWLNAAVALAAPLFWWAGGLSVWPDIAAHVAVAVLVFGIAAGLFAVGQMGGGDVKLIAALALWFPASLFLNMLMIMALIGYILTMGLGAMRVTRAGGLRSRDTLVLAAFSVVAGLLIAGFAGVVEMPLPQVLREAAGSSLPIAFLIFQLPVIVLAYVSIHAIVIFRRRQVRVDAPYGLAISGAALWLIAGQFAGVPALQGLAA